MQARILKSHGTDGGLLIGFRGMSPDDIDIDLPVYISFDGLPAPFFIQELEWKGNSKAIIHLNDVKDLKDAEEMVGRDIEFSEDAIMVEEDDSDGIDITAFEGWLVMDEHNAPCGRVTAFEDIPGNPCLYVETQTAGEVLLPLHEDLVISISEERKEISLRIPAGLI